MLHSPSSSAKKQVIGARYVSGVFTVGNRVKLVRKGEEIGRGTVTNLQQARADVREIKTDGNFGTEIESRADAGPNDEIIAFAVQES